MSRDQKALSLRALRFGAQRLDHLAAPGLRVFATQIEGLPQDLLDVAQFLHPRGYVGEAILDEVLNLTARSGP